MANVTGMSDMALGPLVFHFITKWSSYICKSMHSESNLTTVTSKTALYSFGAVDERLKIIWLPNNSKNLCYLLLNRGECIENCNESWWHYRILYYDFYLYMYGPIIYLLSLRFCEKCKVKKVWYSSDFWF